MNDNLEHLMYQAGLTAQGCWDEMDSYMHDAIKQFAELIVKEMCGIMEKAEDDAYHCFEPSERPTEYIEWLRDWQERFTKHFGVEE